MTTRQTTVSIDGDRFLINGQPTYEGRHYQGRKIEGLLLNSRMVQGVFDDLNPETHHQWAYPDGPWDAERNIREFLEAMPVWRATGLLGFTINLQGGSPYGYSKDQPWHNSGFADDGSLVDGYFDRLARILDRADELGMVAILGLFYFGQDERLRDETAIVRAVDLCTDWLVGHGYTNTLVEIANEADVPRYEHNILLPEREHELIERVQRRSWDKLSTPAGRLLVSTSMAGGSLPTAAMLETADFVLLHGNQVDEQDAIRQMVRGLPQFLFLSRSADPF